MTELGPGAHFGRYQITRRLGAGGMGEVFEAVHVDLQKRVALKVLHDLQSVEPTSVQRFVLEARAASRLSHPNVISVSDVGVEGGRPYMVMELLEGDTLLERLRHGPLTLEQTVAVMLPLISAVGAAHDEGILHRDLKPENVILARVGRGERPTLLDFGISRFLGSERRLTRWDRAVGTPQYMSPEQFASIADIDGRADQFALGVILYECLTGVLPYALADIMELVAAVREQRAVVPSVLRPELSPVLDAIVMRAMKAKRNDRFSTVRDLGHALWPFGSLVTQAVWVEEFGDRSELAERISSNPAPRPSPVPQTPARERITAQHLRAFHAFEECDDAALEELAAVMAIRKFASGDRIVDQGAHAHACFLLISGEVEVVKETRGQRFQLSQLGAGAVFGTIALLDHVPRTASVVGKMPGTVAEISRADFERLLAAKSEAAHHFRLQVAIAGIRQLRRATKRLTQLLDDRGMPCSTSDLAYVQAAAQEPSVPLPTEPGIKR